MRLVVVAREYPPRVGGMEVHAVELVQGLARRHDLHVLIPRDGTPGVRPDGAVTHLPILTDRFAGTMRRAVRAIRDVRPDAILVLNAGYGALAGRVALPVVARVVGNDFERAWVGPRLPGRFLYWRLPVRATLGIGGALRRLDQRFRNRAVQRDLRGCRVILANSDYTRTALVRAGVAPERIRVVLGGVDLARFRPMDRDEARAGLGLTGGPIVVTAGRLTHKKGIDVLLRALPELRAAHPGLTCVVIGRGQEEPALRALALSAGVDGAVRFPGNVSHDDLPRYLAAADVYVQPSRGSIQADLGTVDVETMGRAACEAAACGRPAVVTRTGGLPDVVLDGETGLVVPEEDPTALAQAIRRILGDDALRARLARAAGERARASYGWDTVVRQTEEALLLATATGSRPGAVPD